MHKYIVIFLVISLLLAYNAEKANNLTIQHYQLVLLLDSYRFQYFNKCGIVEFLHVLRTLSISKAHSYGIVSDSKRLFTSVLDSFPKGDFSQTGESCKRSCKTYIPWNVT